MGRVIARDCVLEIEMGQSPKEPNLMERSALHGRVGALGGIFESASLHFHGIGLQSEAVH